MRSIISSDRWGADFKDFAIEIFSRDLFGVD